MHVERDPIAGFGIAEHVSNFLLHESFQYAHQAAAYEVAGILFGERITSIDPDPSWKLPEMPESLPEWLKKRQEIDQTILDPTTIERMSDAWQSAQHDAWDSGKEVAHTQILTSVTDVVGYVVNLTVCLESVLNRHLFLLRESNELSPDHFKSVDRAELMPKLLFCFKEQILSRSLHVSRIKQLVSLRNKAVHYRVDGFRSLSLNVGDMLGIWRELGGIFAQTTGEPSKGNIEVLTNGFVNRWVHG
jgi:hypothetical protein